MSTHYTVLLSLPLNPVLATQCADLLDFVFNDNSPQPTAFPPHPFFDSFNPDFRLHRAYRDFPTGAWQSVFWREFAADHSIRSAGVNLCLPAQKLEGVWEEPRSYKVLVSMGRLLKHATEHQDLVPTDGNHSN